MFAPPQCTLGGEFPSVNTTPISDVYCDPSGAIWAVHVSGTRVFYYSALDVEAVTTSTFSSSPSSSSATVMTPPAPLFECAEGDHVLAIVFPKARPAAGHSFACILTTQGCLALVDSDEPVSVLRQCDLGTPLSAATAVSVNEVGETPDNGVGVLVSSFDGTFSEVRFVQWEGNDNATVNAAGLFRIRGFIHSVMFDELSGRIMTVTQRGDVDVWNWQKGFDETLTFGMPAYSVDDYGEPSCSLLLSGWRLWIGTKTGCIVVFCLEMDTSDASPRHVWKAHDNGVEIHSLLLMSLGRHVWSYAADRQAFVWDAEAWTLQGSFEFPGDGFSNLNRGLPCMNTTLWGINRAVGRVAWFTVKEPLVCGDMGLLAERDECTVQRNELNRFHVLETLLSYLCSQLTQGVTSEERHEVREGSVNTAREKTVNTIKKKEEEEEDGEDMLPDMLTPPYIDVTLHQLEEKHPTVRLLPPAVASLISGQRMLRRALADAGLRSRSFLEDIQLLLQEHRRYRELQAQVHSHVSQIHQEVCHNGEMCGSLDDVVDVVRDLMQRVNRDSFSASPVNAPGGENCRGHSRALSGSAEDIPSVMASHVVGAKDDAHVRRLEEDFLQERQHRQRSEAQLAEVYDEKRELQRQLTQSMRVQEEHEERVLSLERLLKTAKKAAAVRMTEATRLSEMEAVLQEARHTITLLQEKVEGLMREKQELLHTREENKSLHTLVRQFELKERIAKKACASFIETQGLLLDKLEDMLPDTNTEDVPCQGVTSLYEWLCTRVADQREFLVGLKHSYTQQCEKGA